VGGNLRPPILEPSGGNSPPAEEPVGGGSTNTCSAYHVMLQNTLWFQKNQSKVEKTREQEKIAAEAMKMKLGRKEEMEKEHVVPSNPPAMYLTLGTCL
jgi:hypothetical protein